MFYLFFPCFIHKQPFISHRQAVAEQKFCSFPAAVRPDSLRRRLAEAAAEEPAEGAVLMRNIEAICSS
jgi:hypothetical protein